MLGRPIVLVQNGVRQIGQITSAGDLSEFPLPPAIGPGIAAGPDGNLWFT